ncbi:MAG: ATP-binding protein [Alkalispirochaeta sp.]
MSGTEWMLLVERAADTGNLSQRVQLWMDAIDRPETAPHTDALTAFSPPEATGVVHHGGLPAAQVYALGVLGYALLSGTVPWDDIGEDELLHRVLTTRLPEFSRPHWPPVFQGRMNRVIARATDKDPAARYSTPGHLKAEVMSAVAALNDELAGMSYEPRIHRDAYRRIVQWLDRARTGTAATLTVVGASGIGKTYLWETVHDTHARSDERWLYVKTGQGGQRPYETIALLLESIRDEVEMLLGEARVSPPLRALVRAIEPRIAPSGVTTDAAEVLNPARELAHLIGRVGAASRFRVICFDDFQWIDVYSRRVIEELAHGSGSTTVVTLTRDEHNLGSSSGDSVYLKPLNREEAHELARSLEPGTDTIPPETFELAYTLSGGIPMAFHSVLRDGTRWTVSESGDVLIDVASQRVAAVSPLCRSVLSVLALVGVPTSLSLISRAGDYSEAEITSALAEGETALLVNRSRLYDSVRFVHDSIETAVRRGAEQDSVAAHRAIRVLIADARDGNDRAAYAAIGLLSTVEAEEVSQDDWNWVLTAAARQAVYSLAPDEALRIVGDWRDRVSPAARVGLFLIAHEAAYLLGDRHQMSRYYRAIVASGDGEAAAEARYLWIRRCYADARFPGAVAVGIRVLSEADVIEDTVPWSSDGAEALRFLRRHAPARVLSAILRRGYTTDRAVRRATDTLGRMLLPVLTTDRRHLIHLAYYALRIGMERGATPLTALGFITWALYLGTQRQPGRWVEEYMSCAEQLSALSGDRIADHSVRMLIAGFGAPWTGSYRTFADRLERLQSEGREVGNWEFVAHALHLQRQTLLWRGEPLATVRNAFDEIRREIRSYGLVRADAALAKYAAAAEALMGLTDDPAGMDGEIVNERDYIDRILSNNDQMSLAGFRAMKALLALYADRPQEAYDQLTKIDEVSSSISLFHENLHIRFYLGIAAYRLGRPVTGRRMLKVVRAWARENPATHRHRLLFIRAERAAHHGHRRIARALLARAIPRAMQEGFFSEAALMAERAGDISEDRHYWMVAESAYRHWGAVYATARLCRKLGWSDVSPPSAVGDLQAEHLQKKLSEARSAHEVIPTLARHLFESTHASQVVLSLRGDEGVSSQAYRWTGTDIAPSGAPSSDLSLIITEASAGECRLLSAEDSLRGGHPGVVGRSDRVHDSDVAILVVGAVGGAAYTPSVVQTVRAALHAGALYIALLSARARIGGGEQALRETREQLSATERYRRQLFSTVTDAFLLVDWVGNVRFSNPAAEPYLEHASVPAPTFRTDLRGAFRELVDPADGILRNRGRYHTNDDRHVQIQVAPVGSETEDLVAVSISDITEAIDREAQLAQQERQLVVADRLASIGMFSASIVHEISNPNHILQLNTQSLLVVLSWLRSEIDDESTAATVAQAGDIVAQIEDAARRVESVLQMVKSYSREGRRERWGVLAPEEVCFRAFRFSKIMASQYTDHFRQAVPESVAPVWGEPALLEQALVNLIKNACEALPARDGRVELQTYTDSSGTEVVLAVCDTGSGFPAGLRDSLGTPFMSGRFDEGGTGLGLSIVSGIVEKHRGYLRVTDDERFTTRVEIHFPVHTAPVDQTSVSTG